jgi:hypothetical protein
MKVRLSVFLSALTAGAALLPASASAGTLDQQQPTMGPLLRTIDSGVSEAQTFTAGISGGLDQADLALQHFGSPTHNLIVEIRDGSAAGPGIQILATQSLTPSSVPTTTAFVPVAFSPPAPVVAGQQYAIVAWSTVASSNQYDWQETDGTNGDLYPPGGPFFTNSASQPPTGGWNSLGPTSDFAFKTYVIPAATGERAAALRRCKKRAHKHHWPHNRLKKCKRKANLLPV